MKKKTSLQIFLSIFIFSMLCSTVVFASNGDVDTGSLSFGAMTILPPLVSIVLAFITRNVIVSLFLGTFYDYFHKAFRFSQLGLCFTPLIPI